MLRKNTAIVLGLVLVLGVSLWLLTTQNGGFTNSDGAKPVIGGPFELTDHTGKKVTNKDYLGKFMLVYFGFTYCPDICPSELQHIAGALDIIGKERRKHITPLFITIDPERDNQELMSDYVENFHPDLVGLVGTSDQIDKVTKAYRVFFRKVEEKGKPGAYTMDHSALVFLMDDKGRYVSHFAYGTPPERMSRRIIEALDKRFSIPRQLLN